MGRGGTNSEHASILRWEHQHISTFPNPPERGGEGRWWDKGGGDAYTPHRDHDAAAEGILIAGSLGGKPSLGPEPP